MGDEQHCGRMKTLISKKNPQKTKKKLALNEKPLFANE